MKIEKITNNLPESKVAGLFKLGAEQIREIQELEQTKTVGESVEESLSKEASITDVIDTETEPINKDVTTDNLEVTESVSTEDTSTELDKNKATDVEHQDNPSIDFSDLVQSLITSGEFSDLEVISGDDDETKVNLSEMKNVDKDFLLDIIREQTKISKESLKDQYISIDGVSDTRKQLAEIILRGTEEDIDAIKNNPHLINDPYEGYDLSNQDHLYSILLNNYMTEGNLSENKARLLASQSIKDGTIEVEVQDIIDKANQSKTEALNKIKTDRITEQLEAIKKTKELKKGMLNYLKDKGVDTVKATKYANIATEKNSNGDFRVDDMYFEWASDPEKAAKLVHFMMDEEDYLKRATFKSKVITTGKELRQITRTNTSSAKASVSQEGPNRSFRFTEKSKIM